MVLVEHAGYQLADASRTSLDEAFSVENLKIGLGQRGDSSSVKWTGYTQSASTGSSSRLRFTVICSERKCITRWMMKARANL